MTKSLPDEELMLQVRNGATETLAALFDRYQTPLFNFYCRLTADRVLSEDLVQDVFFRVLKYRRSYRPGTAFRPWLYQIARNTRFDHVAKRRHEACLPSDATPSPPLENPTDQNQNLALLHRALLQLPDDKREILILCRFQELKYDEVARLLGCETGTVKVRVHRALQELRNAFQHLERSGAQKEERVPHARSNLSFPGGGDEL